MNNAYEIVKEHNTTSNKIGKWRYGKKVYGTVIIEGNKVLVHDLSEWSGSGKLRSYWRKDIHNVVDCAKDLSPILK